MGCIPCRGKLSIDNGYRTQCIDPYRDVYPSLINMVLFQSKIALSAVGFISSSFSLVVFMKKKKTPVVVSSDFTASMIHLIIINLAFIASIFPQLLNPSETVCIIGIFPVHGVRITWISVVILELIHAKNCDWRSRVPEGVYLLD